MQTIIVISQAEAPIDLKSNNGHHGSEDGRQGTYKFISMVFRMN